ncbi:uncharacterized protein L969DRAFT_94785 [Mixia osmundae IAM 14324]|uniref:Uncharacterized protein n=1 Tax=Mixia osmundae (strain CBS 9802 / IAM 14324 / JCM 22182 / KY 12970) TaxID=764103 RepID=G7E484_MIXOS|nr:uncharacterized protein L969DRAFT_94785 [Mixia osmundae IAM 14324]KEI39740.1 hypothetical protein L969DRAFT_94785 [Mixia osmundae IAM 14324]GAA97644.1 hypothetical protein E5Q_04322 [Mixia osmundae IAM 14324]
MADLELVYAAAKARLDEVASQPFVMTDLIWRAIELILSAMQYKDDLIMYLLVGLVDFDIGVILGERRYFDPHLREIDRALVEITNRDADPFTKPQAVLNDIIWPKDSPDGYPAPKESLDWPAAWQATLAASPSLFAAARVFANTITTNQVHHPKAGLHGPNDFMGVLRRLDELSIMRFEQSVLEKPDWQTKLGDTAIVDRWREESAAQGIEDDMFDYALAELRYFSDSQDKLTGIMHSSVPAVMVSDKLIDEADAQELRNLAERIETTEPKDYHPGSNDIVLDLVHPSLYCYVRGRTRRYAGSDQAGETPSKWPAPSGLSETAQKITSERESVAQRIIDHIGPQLTRNSFVSPQASLDHAGQGRTTKGTSPAADQVESAWPAFSDRRTQVRFFDRSKVPVSSDYQWLPVDILVRDDCASKLRSYIPNLHPILYADAYPMLERIISRMWPLFESAIQESRRYGQVEAFKYSGRHRDLWDTSKAGQPPQEYNYEEDDIDTYYEDIRDWQRALIFKRPPVKPFSAPKEIETRWEDWPVKLRDGEFQLIVKLANVHLTPDKPAYDGSSWHVEGTLTERIVATGLYYYDEENISTSRLSFRQSVAGLAEDEAYEQDQHSHLTHLYGASNSASASQHLGSVHTPQGRALSFVNGMQHRVEPFGLADPSLPGHRKILALFLVDPTNRILSTSDVPPMRHDWAPNATGDYGLMDLEEAQQHRANLMTERAAFTSLVDGVFQQEYALCEH